MKVCHVQEQEIAVGRMDSFSHTREMQKEPRAASDTHTEGHAPCLLATHTPKRRSGTRGTATRQITANYAVQTQRDHTLINSVLFKGTVDAKTFTFEISY